jgi:hypothetical protein
MNTTDWKCFTIDELFIVSLTKGDIKADRIDDGSTPLVSSGETNNGIVKYITSFGDGIAKIFNGNTITLDMFGNAYYQPNDFFAVGHGRVNILIPKFKNNQYISIFLVCLINKEKYRFSYGRSVYSSVAEKIRLKLPIRNNGNPDWQWIEDYVKRNLVPKLPDKSKSVWEKCFESKPLSNNKLKLNTKEWKWFRVGTLFGNDKGTIQKCKCNSATELLQDGTDIAYIGAKKSDNGIMRYVQMEKTLVTKGNCMLFIGDGQGSVGFTLYQPKDFIGSTTLFAGYNEHLNQYNAMFLIGVLDLERYRYSYGRKYKPSETRVKLPAIKNAQGEYEPDWQWMEDYIKGLPYSGCL